MLHFRKPEAAPEPGPTVQEIRECRALELRRDLAKLNAESEILGERAAAFRMQHLTFKNNRLAFLTDDPSEFRKLDDELFALDHRADQIHSERNKILAELSELVTNEKESKHIAGVNCGS